MFFSIYFMFISKSNKRSSNILAILSGDDYDIFYFKFLNLLRYSSFNFSIY